MSQNRLSPPLSTEAALKTLKTPTGGPTTPTLTAFARFSNTIERILIAEPPEFWKKGRQSVDGVTIGKTIQSMEAPERESKEPQPVETFPRTPTTPLEKPTHGKETRDPFHKKTFDSMAYGVPAICLGLAASIASVEAVASHGYLISQFLLEHFPKGFETASGPSISAVFQLKNAIVLTSFVGISAVFAKFAFRNTVRKNPYVQRLGPALRLESTPFAPEWELHFFAEESFYEEAAKKADPEKFIAVKLFRDLEKSIATFATDGYLKRSGGIEPISEIVAHSPLLTRERATLVERMVSKHQNLECSVRPERLPIWKERAAEIFTRNLPIPFFAKWFGDFPKSRDFVLAGSKDGAWIGPKWREHLLTAVGLFQWLADLPAETFQKLRGQKNDRGTSPYCRVSVRYRPGVWETGNSNET